MNISNDDGKKNSGVLIIAGRYSLGFAINTFNVIESNTAHFSNVNNSTVASISKYKEQSQI